MSNRINTQLHRASARRLAAIVRAGATDRRQAVSLATWAVYAASLSDEEMHRNFRIDSFKACS